MRNILSFDVESNGLHGEGFAVGAVILDRAGTVLARFEGRSAISGDVDPWVAENILPVLDESGLGVTYASARELRSAFWTWLDMKDLSEAPTPVTGSLWERLGFWWQEAQWAGIGKWFNEQIVPERFWWWWRGSAKTRFR